TQAFGDPVLPQEAQKAVADPAARHRADLFLDRLESQTRRSALPQVEQHRVDVGEPADRARQVHSGEEVLLTPMAFEIDEQQWIAGPGCEALRQSSQQYVI